mgnify:CR=1 FL=1
MRNSTRRIPLSRGKFTIVDSILFDYLNQWKWNAEENKRRRADSVWYATRGFMRNGKRFTMRMHQEIAIILGFPKGDSDHKNRDGLDNRIENLRPCNQSQNNGNRVKWPGCTSQFKGCWFDPKRQQFEVKIACRRIRYHIGRFRSEHQAMLAYLEAAEILFGEFARVK